MLVLLGIAFLAGVITAISPCVLPVLPIILAGSAASTDRRRPYAIVLGLVVSFTTFTLAGAALLSALGLPEDLLRNIAIVALLVLAASLLSQRVAWILERPFLFLTRRRVGQDSNGFLVGLSVGLVFVPCAGPVLAAVTALAASGEITFRIVLVTAAYAIGAALPMLAIAVGGQRLGSGMTVVRAHADSARKAAGVIVGATALAIALGVDQRFTTAVPGYTSALQNRIERSSAARTELESLDGRGEAAASSSSGDDPLAPDFRDIELWLNTPDGGPLSLAGLRGKVVLVDFWTYSCINCLRTLPHLKAWDAAYRKDGLVIVGVHSPEFAFERVPDNVRSATQRLGVRYPVALDNDFATWRAYSNDYWPAEYLIDRSGHIRHEHFGEGNYDETENVIRRLLGEKEAVGRTSVLDATPSQITTPESYLGYARLERLANARVAYDAESTYSFPMRPLGPDQLAYAGRWRVEPARAIAGPHAKLRLRFQANDIFLVLGGRGRVRVLVNGEERRSVDVTGTPRLYTLERFPTLTGGLLELRFSPGVEAYAFTFG